MSKLGRPRGTTRKGNITRGISLPAELYKKCVWIADLWSKESLTDDFDGSQEPEYWTVPRVISSVLGEYFESLESHDADLTSYFERCRLRDLERKSISKSPTQPQPSGI